MELCSTDYYWRVPLHQASVPKPTSFDTAQMSDSLPPVKKCAWSPAVKMMEKINNIEGNQWAGRRVRGPLLFLLEQPFIRYPSCWVIYFSILLAMLLIYGLAGNGMSVCFLKGTGLIFWGGKQRRSEQTQSGLKSRTFCRFRSAIYSS